MDKPSCHIKRLPEDLRASARERAIALNPQNAGPILPPGVALPAMLGVLNDKRFFAPNGVRLTVGFMETTSATLRARILKHMNAWGAWSNVRFTESKNSPQVRISRTPGDGHWSYLGTDVLEIPPAQATMNLDGFTMSTPDEEFYRVVRHETGHTLGFDHEHLREEVVKRIDAAKAIKYFRDTNGWSEEDTRRNVLTAYPNSALTATLQPDVHSVMCYSLPGSIMKDGVAVPGGPDIDAIDAAFAAKIYPGPAAPHCIHPHNPRIDGEPGGRAYFFKGPQYARFHPIDSRVEAAYPRATKNMWPGLPTSFANGVNAAVVWGDGKLYFFKGSKYARYDIAKDAMDEGYPRLISAGWQGVWPTGIDAGVVWPNGKAYFFKGHKYVRFDIKTDRVDPGYPKAIAEGWSSLPAAFKSGIDAVVVWDDGKAYFFKGDKYVRFDIANDRVDAGYPSAIKTGWPGLWTAGIDA